MLMKDKACQNLGDLRKMIPTKNKTFLFIKQDKQNFWNW